MLSKDLYRKNLVGFNVDEAHCVKKWLDTYCYYCAHSVHDTIIHAGVTALGDKFHGFLNCEVSYRNM